AARSAGDHGIWRGWKRLKSPGPPACATQMPRATFPPPFVGERGRTSMKFGHFDDKAREYVVTRPDTPKPWSNYLGTTEYGAIITNHAGGYSFYRSAANQRVLRMRGNSV